jgi:hypothetical protein
VYVRHLENRVLRRIFGVTEVEANWIMSFRIYILSETMSG